LAAVLGLPFAFASHFAPDLLLKALEVYRATYRPSAEWPAPHAMVGVNVIAADTDDAAARLFTSLQQRFLGMQRGRRGPLPRPIDPAQLESMWTAQEKHGVQRMLAASAVGSPRSVRQQLDAIVEQTAADELIAAGAIHDHAARLRSYELLAAA
jgi:luciferase family oxidoreductase group 1